ncbi:MAG: DUF1549 domain-containing protein [Planctomycetes bacterium]|nr:DUF1549 domain-containing protein [Planctomycetota bacterium]
MTGGVGARAAALALVGLAATVVAQPAPRATDFVLDVQPWLLVRGCATAKCHGGAGGRGGFALSLFGSDPLADHRALTLLDDARRIDLVDPERSLVLGKPARALPHRGGRRLREGDEAWTALRDWIAGGAPFRAEGGFRIAALRADPVAIEGGVRLVGIARLVDGAGETRDEPLGGRALWETSDPNVATVDADGTVRVVGPGEAWVFLRFAARSEVVWRVVEPFAPGRAAAAPAEAARHPLDRAIDAGLAELGLGAAAGPAPDHLLARRLWLDLAGRPPRADELAAFVAAAGDAERVGRTVALLTAPGTADFEEVWSERLAQMLGVESPVALRDGPPRARAMAVRAVIAEHVRSGEVLGRLVERLVRLGAPGFFASTDPRDRAELTARGFLGIRIGCARCHDHPQDRWRRSDHEAFAALFAVPRPAERAGDGPSPGVLFDDRGRAVAPGLLPLASLEPVPVAAETDLAPVRRFLLDDPAARRQLARHVANRTIAWLFGAGLVEPVDDLRPTNPPRCAAALDVLADELLRTGLDLRALLRFVATSETYARASVAPTDPRARALWLGVRPTRELEPWLVRRAAQRALALPATTDFAPLASALADRLAALHGGPAGATELLDVVRTPGNLIDASLLLDPSGASGIDELFLALWSRWPAEPERAAARRALDAAASPTDGLRAVALALCNARSFTFVR